MNEQQLKPCPFCNSPATTYRSTGKFWVVTCTNYEHCAAKIMSYGQLERVVSQWNTRAGTPT